MKSAFLNEIILVSAELKVDLTESIEKSTTFWIFQISMPRPTKQLIL